MVPQTTPADEGDLVAGAQSAEHGSVMLNLVDVIAVKRQEPGRLLWSSSTARDVAGFDRYKSIRYDGSSVDGALLAVGLVEQIDGRSRTDVARLRASRRDVTFAKSELETALGITVDDVQDDKALRLAVFASDGVLTFILGDDVGHVSVPAECVRALRDV